MKEFSDKKYSVPKEAKGKYSEEVVQHSSREIRELPDNGLIFDE